MTGLMKLHKNIIIEISLIAAAAFSIYFSRIDIFILLFSVTIHELGHIIAAMLLGARTENFIIHGFGVELIFPGKTPTPNKMLILAAGGPVASFILAFLSKLCGNTALFITNISVALINLLPVAPLDGGNILSGLLAPHLPRKALRKITALCGKLFGAIVSLCGIFVLIISNFNISLLYLGLFIFFSSGRLSNPVTEITSADYGKAEKCSVFLIDENSSLLETASYLPVNSIGAVRNSSGEIISFITPLQLYHQAVFEHCPSTVKLNKLKNRPDTAT